MKLFLDSAREEDARQAKALGWVAGITTNPLLIAATGLPTVEVLHRLGEVGLAPLWYQLTAPDADGMEHEAQALLNLFFQPVVFKIPPTPAGFQFVSRGDHACAVTAVYSPAQALAAAAAGADYVIVYVNRATRLMGDGPALVRSIARVLDGAGPQIVAASLKSADEAAEAAAAGAQMLTLSLDVLQAMMRHPYSDQAVEEFNHKGAGLGG